MQKLDKNVLSEAKKDLNDLAPAIIKTVFQSAIRYGSINPKNKSKDAIEKEFIDYIKRHKEDFKYLVIDYSDNILKYARQLRNKQEYQLSCLLYATWFEHWINGVVDSFLTRKNIPKEDAVMIIRNTKISDKISWLFKLLGLKEIFPLHRKKIIRVLDLRNSFVHYKWPAEDMDKERKEEAEALKGIEKTISYLKRYDTRIFGIQKKLSPRFYK